MLRAINSKRSEDSSSEEESSETEEDSGSDMEGARNFTKYIFWQHAVCRKWSKIHFNLYAIFSGIPKF